MNRALHTELQVIEKMMLKNGLLKDSATKDSITKSLKSLHDDVNDASSAAEEKAAEREREREKTVNKEDAERKEEEAEDEEEGTSDTSDDLNLDGRMADVTSAFGRLQTLVQRRMQAKDQMLLEEQDQRARDKPFWKKVLGL